MRIALRPRAGMVLRDARRTSGSARQEPQATGEPSASLLPHQRTGPRRRARTLSARGRMAASHRAAGGTPGRVSPWDPGAGIVIPAAWRTSGSARQQPQEAEGTSHRGSTPGCGTGEHTLMAARIGLDAIGIDAAPAAIALAEAKAHDRNIAARFLVHDALRLPDLGTQFDTVLDSGLFHVFDDSDRRTYVQNLKAAIAPGGHYFMLCFSERQPGEGGPRRVSQAEIRDSFSDGWRVDAIDPAILQTRLDPPDIQGWFARITRI
jgi:SAM-dependent methyltransferase